MMLNLFSRKERAFYNFGRLSREKGIRTLIDAIRATGYRLVVAGNGPLIEVIGKVKTGNIELAGFKQGRELEGLIRGASFIVIPSEWYENNPMSLLEAYSFGKPVIGAEIGGISEVILEGETGFLFKSRDRDSLIKKLELAASIQTEEYVRLSRGARKFAESNFDPDAYYKELTRIYKYTINNRA